MAAIDCLSISIYLLLLFVRVYGRSHEFSSSSHWRCNVGPEEGYSASTGWVNTLSGEAMLGEPQSQNDHRC